MNAYCWFCDAPILYAMTSDGRTMPLDAAPVEDGTIRVAYRRRDRRDVYPHAEILSGEALDAARSENEPLWIIHYASCPSPNAAQWVDEYGSEDERRYASKRRSAP